MTRNNIIIKKEKADDLLASSGSVVDKKKKKKSTQPMKQLSNVFCSKNKSIFQNKSEKRTGQLKILI